ncbi:hypothetical protein BDR07DRAFT_1386892 [Suillus spraguei]|nr:hypothetical protein BDR07DRAFT_1386892 [Suillus spraguei]
MVYVSQFTLCTSAWAYSICAVEAMSKTRVEGLRNFFEEARLFRFHSMFDNVGMEIVTLLTISRHPTIDEL